MSQLDEAASELPMLMLMFIVEFKWICVVFCVFTEDTSLNLFNDSFFAFVFLVKGQCLNNENQLHGLNS